MRHLRIRLTLAFRAYLAFLKKHALGIVSTFLILIGLIVVLWPYSVHYIPAGHKAVLFKRFAGGTDLDVILDEGTRITFPWDIVTIYNVQIQQKTTELELLTSDRLKSKVTLSFQFLAYPFNLPLLHKYIGPDYYHKVILPIIEAAARDAVAKYSADEAFTNDIKKISQTITLDTTRIILDRITPTGLTDVRLMSINDVQVVKFSYPQDVEQALQQKAIELARAEAYTYRLLAEKREAERKAIEASGIRDFQKIVDNGLTESYLRLKGIEATKELALSNNAKVVLFGNSPGGLPLILGSLDQVPGPGPTKAAAATSEKSPVLTGVNTTGAGQASAGTGDLSPTVVGSQPPVGLSSNPVAAPKP